MSSGMVYIIPPICDVTVPLLGPHQLKGFAEKIGYPFVIKDLNIQLFEYVIRKALKAVNEYKRDEEINGLNAIERTSCLRFLETFNDIRSYNDLKICLKNCNDYSVYWRIIDFIRACYDFFSYDYIEEGIRFRLDGIDCDYEKIKLEELVDSLCKSNLGSWIDSQINLFMDDVTDIGINITFESQLLFAILISKLIKKKNSGARIFVGGGFINSNISKSVSAGLLSRFFDIICYGEGEPLLWVLKNKNNVDLYNNCTNGWVNAETLTRKKFQISPPSFNDLDNYFSPNQIIPLRLTSTCYWNKCKFCVDEECSNTLLLKNAQCENMINYCIDNLKKGAFDGIYFLDSAIPLRYLERFCKAILEEGLQCKWGTNLRFDKEFANRHVIELFARAGCKCLRFGLESGSQRVIDLMNKGIRLEDAAYIIALCKEYGILIHTYVMVGYPGENDQDRLKTERFLLDDYTHPDNYSCSEFILYPNSEIAKEIKNSKKNGVALNLEKYKICDVAEQHRFVKNLRRAFDTKYKPTDVLFSPGHTISYGKDRFETTNYKIVLYNNTVLKKNDSLVTSYCEGLYLCAIWHRRDGVAIIELKKNIYELFVNCAEVGRLIEEGLNTETIYELIEKGFLCITFEGSGQKLSYQGEISIPIRFGNVYRTMHWYGYYDMN